MADADPLALGREAAEMIEALARLSSDPDRLTRLFLSPAHREAADLTAEMMRDAGLTVTEDALGTVRGRLAATAAAPSNRRLLVGSHIDTVIDAGKYDGALGVICGILAAKEITRRGIEAPFAIDVLAFGDEEGVRFPTTLLTSAAVAGHASTAALQAADADGVTVAEALRAFGGDPDRLADCAEDPGEVIGYCEVHIEQGPVLEAQGQPLGVVTSIAGAGRFKVTVTGEAGHAGTVPMALRRDALAAAAELMLAIEETARRGAAQSLVATVGSLEVKPGAVNVIPAEVTFSLDIRGAEDEPRRQAVEWIESTARQIGARRGVTIAVKRYHEVATRPCALRLQEAGAEALKTLGIEPLRLMSGAGHDGQAMAALCDIGMLFVRCRGGVSHNPLENVTIEDMGLAVEALVQWIAAVARNERMVR